jgi:hypothetical protein
MRDAKLAPRQATRARKAPPKRWRNRWRHSKNVVFESGFRIAAGVRLGPSVFPSREIAEQRAAEWLRDFADVAKRCGVIYLGPVPDPDRA